MARKLKMPVPADPADPDARFCKTCQQPFKEDSLLSCGEGFGHRCHPCQRALDRKRSGKRKIAKVVKKALAELELERGQLGRRAEHEAAVSDE